MQNRFLNLFCNLKRNDTTFTIIKYRNSLEIDEIQKGSSGNHVKDVLMNFFYILRKSQQKIIFCWKRNCG